MGGGERGSWELLLILSGFLANMESITLFPFFLSPDFPSSLPPTKPQYSKTFQTPPLPPSVPPAPKNPFLILSGCWVLVLVLDPQSSISECQYQWGGSRA